jgi:hypothetical protein
MGLVSATFGSQGHICRHLLFFSGLFYPLSVVQDYSYTLFPVSESFFEELFSGKILPDSMNLRVRKVSVEGGRHAAKTAGKDTCLCAKDTCFLN